MREEDHLPSAAELIRKELQKKHYDPEVCDDRLRQKIIASLMRKGYRMHDILSVMRDADSFD